eukprot:4871633-Pyramimonas_sp.AAC.1
MSGGPELAARHAKPKFQTVRTLRQTTTHVVLGGLSMPWVSCALGTEAKRSLNNPLGGMWR